MSAAAGYDALGLGGAVEQTAPRIRIAAPTTGEEEVEAVRRVLASGVLTNGPATRRFEEAMADRHRTEHAIAFANGTVALAAMYLACGIGPGDEVIVPSLTFISTATSVLHVGATPVFADVSPTTYDIDPDDVARRITPRTKAIVPVHYGGQACQIGRLRELADDHGLVLLEDAAEAAGASFCGRPVGGWGHAAMFSFTPTKNITTGEGAVVTTDDVSLARSMRMLRNHGMAAPYQHEILGWNWRLSDIQSAIGACQVARLDGIIATKQRNAARLDGLLADVQGVTPPARRPGRDHTFMLYTVRIAGGRRDAVLEALSRAGIEARVYFPPAHRQPVFAHLAVDDLPVTDQLACEILSLPVHAHLTDADLAEIAEVVAASVA